jgi:hypothetical protein
MSRKTELRADLDRVGYQLGGSHLTREARSATFKTFAKVMSELGFGIHAAQQIGGRHLKAYAQSRVVEGIKVRTCAKELSHLRAVLRRIDKQGLAKNPAYSNKALGIERGSRLGTKQPMSDATILAFQARMVQLGRPSFGRVLELQRALGLRETEAVRAGQVETLSRWQRELQDHRCVCVIEGTKGGRQREVRPANLDRALAAVQSALALLEATGQAYLVMRADGAVPAGLKQAAKIYTDLCHRAGIQNHAARYSFARERMQAYRSQGFSEGEARAATSLDLGHGDGRGRYVATVYVRGAPEKPHLSK